MENRFLKQKLKKLQNDYCELLERSIEKLSEKDFSYIADEINLYWYRNRNIVEIILKYFAIKGQDTLLFTGTTYIDIDDQELYPFILLGNTYIIDDSFVNLSSFTLKLPNTKYGKDTNKTLLKTALDNISIIKNYPEMYILPVSFLCNEQIEYISKLASNIFINFFNRKEITNLDILFQEFSNLKDLIDAIPKNIQQQLIISENDKDTNLLNNYLVFKESNQFPFNKNTPDIYGFFCLINGYLMRALTILEISFQYNFIPYLRYPLIFQYFALLGYHYKNQPMCSDIIFKGICCHLVHKYFNKSIIKKLDIDEFIKISKTYNFKGKFICLEY